MNASLHGIYTVGVTGGIGSGKSAVCAAFADEGFPVLFADDIAKDLSTTDPVLRRRLAKLLGPETYAADGSYNRAFVASRIFSDPRIKARAESLIHPRVDRELKKQILRLRDEHQAVVIIEAALIYEAGMDEWLDAVLVVEADAAIRRERIRRRDGLGGEEIERRMMSQLDPAEKSDRADYLIKNNGTPEDLRERVRFFSAMFRSLAQLQPS